MFVAILFTCSKTFWGTFTLLKFDQFFQNIWHNFTMKREVNIHTEFILLYCSRHVSKHTFECQEWNSILREACNATKLLKNWHTSYIHEDRQGTHIKPTLSEQYSKASTLFIFPTLKANAIFCNFSHTQKVQRTFNFFLQFIWKQMYLVFQLQFYFWKWPFLRS